MLVVLIGPPGNLGEECALKVSAHRKIPYIVTDRVIETVRGESLDNLAVYDDPKALRMLERDICCELLATDDPLTDRLLVLGSGALGDDEASETGSAVRRALENAVQAGAVAVYLTADFSTLVHRTHLDGPRIAAVASPRKIFYGQLAKRSHVYAQESSITIDTTGMDASAVAQRLEEMLWTA